MILTSSEFCTLAAEGFTCGFVSAFLVFGIRCFIRAMRMAVSGHGGLF